MQLLHRHLVCLVSSLTPEEGASSASSASEQLRLLRPQVQALSAQAGAAARSSQHALGSLPGLPQLCCALEHSRLELRLLRAELALDVLQRLE